MPQPVPLNGNVLLTIGQTLIDEIVTDSGFKLYLAPEFNYEENVSIEGKIAVLPKNYNGELKVGDSVAFSYKVVSDRIFPNKSDHFVPIADDMNDACRIWYNHKGEKLRMMAHQGNINIFWVGTYFDKDGVFQYGTQGTEGEVERWLHNNFKFGNCENFLFKHKFTVDNKDYWKCSLENIFAKKEGDEIIPMNDRLICKAIDIPVDQRQLKEAGIDLPDSMVQIRLYDRAVHMGGGEPIGYKRGDIVSFEEKYCERYTLWGQSYFLVRQRRINGQWIPEQEKLNLN